MTSSPLESLIPLPPCLPTGRTDWLKWKGLEWTFSYPNTSHINNPPPILLCPSDGCVVPSWYWIQEAEVEEWLWCCCWCLTVSPVVKKKRKKTFLFLIWILNDFFLWLQNLKLTEEQYVSKGVYFRRHLVWRSGNSFFWDRDVASTNIDGLPECGSSPYRRFFARSCLCGILIVMASVRRFWCNRILYCPQSIGNKPPLMATHFPVFTFRKERYRAWKCSCHFSSWRRLPVE